MIRVFIEESFNYNATGYDREETVYLAGEQSVPPRVAEHIERAGLGRVLAEGEDSPSVEGAPAADQVLVERIKELEGQVAVLDNSLEGKIARVTELEAELAEAKEQTADERVTALEGDLAGLKENLAAAESTVLALRLDAMNVDELKSHAFDNDIDLGGASTKADIRAAIDNHTPSA